jgi:glycosyltransferase involved in cell wall biosynthesis
MSVSLVLPCYHPPEGWAQNLLANYRDITTTLPEPVQLIVVFDGVEEALVAGDIALLKAEISSLVIVHYAHNRGKGYAIRQGVARATGDVVLYTDIDFPFENRCLVSLYQALKHEPIDIAMGIKDERYHAHLPPLRKVISRSLRVCTRIVLRLPEPDTQCGLKGFKQSVAPLFLSTTIDRYLFDLEFIKKAYKRGCVVKPIPVALKPNVHFRKMNYKILFPELWNFIRVVFS